MEFIQINTLPFEECLFKKKRNTIVSATTDINEINAKICFW